MELEELKQKKKQAEKDISLIIENLMNATGAQDMYVQINVETHISSGTTLKKVVSSKIKLTL